MATEYYVLQICGAVDVSEMMTTMVFKGTGVTANDTLDNGLDLLAAWESSAIGPWLAFNSDHYQVRRITARRVSPHGSAVASEPFQTGEYPGANANECSALQTAPAVRLIPGTLGNTAGRCFLPSPPTDMINNNGYAAGYVTDVATYFDNMQSGISDAFTWTLAIHHRKTDTFSDVVGHNLSPRFGFQGRRRYPIG